MFTPFLMERYLMTLIHMDIYCWSGRASCKMMLRCDCVIL